MARTAIAYVPVSESEVEEMPVGAERLEVVAAVYGKQGHGHGGLVQALERIATGEASALLVGRLEAVAGSLRELLALLDWLEAADAALIALDVDLDTGTAAGRRIVRVLREIERFEADPAPGRSARGRPGLAHRAPELAARVSDLRERGLSLQAIADALNADEVPTLRGGAQWRPSSVQAALGYRRPRPPLPGAPPPPPHSVHPPRPGAVPPPRTPRPPLEGPRR